MHRLLLTLAASLVLVGTRLSAADTKLNVLFILADDLGWADTTLYGHTKYYHTPNLERLAKRGVVFDHAYSASPLCSPTRSAIMTGLSPARIGITMPVCHLPEVVLDKKLETKVEPDRKAIEPKSLTRLDTSYVTLAESLKAAGYVTGHFGKWHLGAEPYSPLQQGFDVDIPHTSGPGPAGGYTAPWKFKNFEPDPAIPHEHIEDRMAKEASAFMEKNKDKPFFLNYWMFSVHSPFIAKKALIQKYAETVDKSDPQRCPTYAAMVESMDDAVGTLLDKLDHLGLAERTLIVFTSDNGGNMYDMVRDGTATSNAPLRGGKATVFEGGTRVPAIIVVPGITAAGTRSSTTIQSEDYYPTILEALHLAPGRNQIFDGISLMPTLSGKELVRTAVFQFFPHQTRVPDWLPPAVTVHRGDWKLIRIFFGGENGAHRYKLYNLKDDLGETKDLAAQNPEMVTELDALIEKYLKDTHAFIPQPNPGFDPKQYHPEAEGIQVKKEKGKDKEEHEPEN